jgi:hypothetical protein
MHDDRPAWFTSDTGAVFMSHNGLASDRHDEGTAAAFDAAYDAGYRWFQVDAVLRGATLVSHHSLIGRAIAIRPKAKRRLAAAVPLEQLLHREWPSAVRWNIEVKSARTTSALVALLDGMDAANRQRLLISSPIRPSIQRRIAASHDDVAFAAPLVHGGVFGVRFLTPGRAHVNGKPFACQQVHHRFVRSSIGRHDRPLRQAWTIRTSKVMHKMLDRQASLIVDSRRVQLPWRAPHGRETVDRPREMPDVQALALGGGGWRAAFGSIGAIMYFQRWGRWTGIHEVVGTSGGSFAVAALAGPCPDVSDPTERLKVLDGRLRRAGVGAAQVVWFGVLAAVGTLGTAGVIARWAWTHHRAAAIVPAGVLLASTPFVVRLVVSLRSRHVVRSVFEAVCFRADPRTGAPAPGEHRYRVAAAGLNDGNLYGFTTHPEHDFARWDLDEQCPRPIAEVLVADAVVRSSSLPGLGQMGRHRLSVRPHTSAGPADADPTHEHVPDRLVDSGISTIFGRGFVEARPPGPLEPTLVVVDAGRALQAQDTGTARDHVRNVLQRLSTLAHLARWLVVAFDASYRKELARVADNSLSDGFRCRLVRLAEEEVVQSRSEAGETRCISAQRQDDLNRLVLLRDRVHGLSLLRVREADADRAIAVAIAACSLEFEEDPDVPQTLRWIGHRLGRGDALAVQWAAIPLMGAPTATVPSALADEQPVAA